MWTLNFTNYQKYSSFARRKTRRWGWKHSDTQGRIPSSLSASEWSLLVNYKKSEPWSPPIIVDYMIHFSGRRVKTTVPELKQWKSDKIKILYVSINIIINLDNLNCLRTTLLDRMNICGLLVKGSAATCSTQEDYLDALFTCQWLLIVVDWY